MYLCDISPPMRLKLSKLQIGVEIRCKHEHDAWVNSHASQVSVDEI